MSRGFHAVRESFAMALPWDDQHPSAKGHAIVASAALAVLAPEPGSMTLIGAGLFALVLIRRRVTA